MQELSKKVNKIALYIDLIDQEINEIDDSKIKHEVKLWCNKVRNSTKIFIKQCDKLLISENQELFGMSADELRVIIDNAIELNK